VDEGWTTVEKKKDGKETLGSGRGLGAGGKERGRNAGTSTPGARASEKFTTAATEPQNR